VQTAWALGIFVGQADPVSAVRLTDLANKVYGAGVQRGETEGKRGIGGREVISIIDLTAAAETALDSIWRLASKGAAHAY
jgi:hypothetical protein